MNNNFYQIIADPIAPSAAQQTAQNVPAVPEATPSAVPQSSVQPQQTMPVVQPQPPQQAMPAAPQYVPVQPQQTVPVAPQYVPVQTQGVPTAPVFAAQPVPLQYQQGYVAPKKERKPIKPAVWISCVVGAVLIIAAAITVPVFSKYSSAKKAMEQGNYSKARASFTELGSFKDSAALSLECDYLKAEELFSQEKYKEAAELFGILASGYYRDSVDREVEAYYCYGAALQDAESYREACDVFASIDYKDSDAREYECFMADVTQHYHYGDFDYVTTALEATHDSDDTAQLYYCLATLNKLKSNYGGLPFAFDVLRPIYEEISAHAEDNEDAADACGDPVFFIMRMFCGNWKCGGYRINAQEKKDSIMINFRLPGKDPRGHSWGALIDGDDLVIYDGKNNWWFTINGFSEQSEIGAGSMYVTCNNGESYTFDYFK